jgi:cysteine synthase A
MQGAIDKAEELVRDNPDYFMPHQFRNRANPDAHRSTTAREILDVVGTDLAALVVGVGTGGTATGAGEVLKEAIPSLQLFAVEPVESQVLSGGRPAPHGIQGIGAGFVPEILNRDVIDHVVPVTYADARTATRKLARTEGILTGVSSGAILHVASQVAADLGKGKRVLAILCDTGERYLSTELFT